jgi:hypothetical protein
MSDAKWEKVDAMIRKSQRTELAPTEPESTPLAPIDAQITQIRSQKLGIIASFKANKIQRNVALQKLKDLTDAQLEGSRHALKRAVEIEKQRVDVVADKYIYQITEEYLKDLRELGIKNYEARMETLMELDRVAARLVEKAEGQDVPDAFKERTLQGILAKHKEFFDRILEEEARLSK